MKLAILASGNGTNAQAVVEAVRAGKIDAAIAVIITNRTDAGIIERARRFGLPIEILPSKGISDRRVYDSNLLELLRRYEVDTVVLAGWMRILSDVMLTAYEGRMINLHPAILPSIPGGTGIHDAYEYGVKLAGCTVHLVSPVLDGGPIIIQAAVPVEGSEAEVEERIHKMEHLILPQALQWLCEGRIRTDGRRVTILPSEKAVSRTAVIDGCLISPALED